MATQQPPSAQLPPPPPQSPQSPPNNTAAAPKTQTPPWIHNSAIGVAILGPIALFMPPRRMGLQAMLLSGGTFWATNVLAYDWTGESMTQRFDRRWQTMFASGLPEKAKRNQELMRLERERREALLPEAERMALQEAREKKEMASRGAISRLWMGGEKEDWRAERARKEKETLQNGEGYGTLIMDQVKEVFSGSKKGQDEEGKEDKTGEGDSRK
ncbi:putative rhomboid family membrane protein [Diaporthe ampelina]|uniref:Putative rhomboid family membrane protein n=1 Tax=Diaporthe ampelina TaxID=1214573 RepID=A0A0G2FEW3_9PEZI|nr:putative rhomboid family membrane protein [Diaporthe ampelina]